MAEMTKRIKNLNGTVHYADAARRTACAPIATHHSWLSDTDEPVTCKRCLARFGDLPVEPVVKVDPYPERTRREAERAAWRAARMGA